MITNDSYLDMDQQFSFFSGFLPTFGPSYVVFYGSPRDMPPSSEIFQELNRGIGEGISYRGRVLLEMSLGLDPCQSDRTVSVNKEALAKYQLFMRQRKFWLLAVFNSATMLSTHEDPVQFEVSCTSESQRSFDFPRY